MENAEIAFPHLGIYFSTVPKSFSIGGFSIAYYGLIIAIGMLAGLMLARWQAKRTNQNKEMYTDFALYAIIFSIIGARLYYVAFSWDNYKNDLAQIVNIRGGGMAIYGAVIAAVITALVYCKIKKYNFFLFADTAVGGLITGQIIGRFGNFMNREAFGEYTDSLFAMRIKYYPTDISPDSITPLMESHKMSAEGFNFIQVHPTFLYEAAWNLVVLILILIFTKKKKFDGQLFLMYLIGYGMGRAWIEGLRTDQLKIGATNIAVSQVLSIVLVVAGIVCWVILAKRAKKKALLGPTEEESLEQTPEDSEDVDQALEDELVEEMEEEIEKNTTEEIIE